MEQGGYAPEDVTYAALIDKARQGGNWQRALELWDSAQAAQVNPKP